ncbi:MAG TPA: hypothetical protein VLS93_11010 [Anaeromyxobacteraceae bacterium]|nr:hypothetical protein [Anaeromyxobacteraceae bacterium]
MRFELAALRALAIAATLLLAPAAVAETGMGERLSRAFGETAFVAWRILDLLSFRILDPVARIIDDRDAGDPRYQGPEGAGQFRRDYLRIVFLGAP